MGADEANPETGLPSKLYMALEHLGGGSLADMVEKQMLTPQYKLYTDEDALRWSMDVASALAYLHDSKPMLIHRDLKPDNIMLTKDKRTAKLIDFGLHSRVRRPEVMDTLPGGQLSMSCASEASSTDSERSMERAGSFLKSEMLERMSIAPTDAAGRYELTGMTGSMCYMAPEVYSAQLYNQQVDIYSLGVIMYGGGGGVFSQVALHTLSNSSTGMSCLAAPCSRCTCVMQSICKSLHTTSAKTVTGMGAIDETAVQTPPLCINPSLLQL